MKSVKEIVLDGLKYFRQALLSDTPVENDTTHALSLAGAYSLQSQINSLNSRYVSASSVTTEQLKKANVVIAHFQTSDSSTISTLTLLMNTTTSGSCQIWNGKRWYTTKVAITWSKTNGTVRLDSSYTERTATVSIVGYYLIS